LSTADIEHVTANLEKLDCKKLTIVTPNKPKKPIDSMAGPSDSPFDMEDDEEDLFRDLDNTIKNHSKGWAADDHAGETSDEKYQRLLLAWTDKNDKRKAALKRCYRNKKNWTAEIKELKADAKEVEASYIESTKKIAHFPAKLIPAMKAYDTATDAATKEGRNMEGTEQKDAQKINHTISKHASDNAAKAKKNGEECFELKK